MRLRGTLGIEMPMTQKKDAAKEALIFIETRVPDAIGFGTVFEVEKRRSCEKYYTP